MLDGVRIEAPVLNNGFMSLGIPSHGLFDKGGFTPMGMETTLSSSIGNIPDNCCCGACGGPS